MFHLKAIARGILHWRRPVRQRLRRARSPSSSPERPNPVLVSVAIQTDASEEVNAPVVAGVKRIRDEDEGASSGHKRRRLTPPPSELSPITQQEGINSPASPVATTSTAIDQRPVPQPSPRAAEIAELENNGRLELPTPPDQEQEQPVKNEPVEEERPVSPPPTQDIIKREVSRSSSAPPGSQHTTAIKSEPSSRPVKRERDLSDDEDEEGTPPKRFRVLPSRTSIARVQPKRSPSPSVLPVALQRRLQGEVNTDLHEQRQIPTAAEIAAQADAHEGRRVNRGVDAPYPLRPRSLFDDPVGAQTDRYGPNPPRHPDGRIDIKAIIERERRASNRPIRNMHRPLRRTERAIIWPRDA